MHETVPDLFRADKYGDGLTDMVSRSRSYNPITRNTTTVALGAAKAYTRSPCATTQ